MNPQFAGMGMGMNFGMQNPNMNFNMNMPNNFMNMNMNMMEMGQDEEWLKGFKMGVEEVNNTGDRDSDANSPGPKINVIFEIKQKVIFSLVIDIRATINQLLKAYLFKFESPILYDDEQTPLRLHFIFNGVILNFRDQTPVGEFFKIASQARIVVTDVENLIGG